MNPLLTAFLLAVASLGAQAADESVVFENNCFRVERVEEIGAYPLWHSRRDGQARSGDGQTILSYWVADREFLPMREDWPFLALVMSGHGDIGEQPEAIVIRSKRDASAQIVVITETAVADPQLILTISFDRPQPCASDETDRYVILHVDEQAEISAAPSP